MLNLVVIEKISPWKAKILYVKHSDDTFFQKMKILWEIESNENSDIRYSIVKFFSVYKMSSTTWRYTKLD